MNDLSGYLIYWLLVYKEAERFGIITTDDYKRYIANVIETLRQQGRDASMHNYGGGCEKLNEQ